MIERRLLQAFLWAFRPVSNAAYAVERFIYRVEKTANSRLYVLVCGNPGKGDDYASIWRFYGKRPAPSVCKPGEKP